MGANELIEQEKNEKLAKWCGFKKLPRDIFWMKPDRSGVYYDIKNSNKLLPDLLHSLDAQEKYLGPVLLELGYEVTIVIYRTGLIVTIRSLKLQADVVTIYYHNTNIAQAFADAVLKLVEEFNART